MSNIINALRKPMVGVLAVLTLACLGLTACGGSSGTSTNAAAAGAAATSTAGTSAGTPTSTSGSSGQGNGSRSANPRFLAIRECLQKNGITLPKRTPGSSGPPPGTSRLGLPKGVTPAQYEAAVKKCGGGRSVGGAGFRRANSPVFRQALAKYDMCLRQNGVNLPAPNTSGRGPTFSTKGINTSGPQFKAATAKCRATLIAAFRSLPRAKGAPGAGASPPAGGSAAGGEGTPSG